MSKIGPGNPRSSDRQFTAGKRLAVIVAAIVVVICLWLVRRQKSATLIVLGEDSSNLKAIDDLKSEYEAKQTGVTIRFDRDKFENAQQKADQDLANQSGVYDIILQYNFSLATYARKGWVLRLDDVQKYISSDQREFEKDIFPNVWDEVGTYYGPNYSTEPGDRVGFPFAANTMLLCYNKYFFDNAENKAAFKSKYNKELTVPRDWETFRQIAEFFTSPDKSTSGLCLEGKVGSWLYYEWCNFAFSMGGGIVADGGNPKTKGWESNEGRPCALDSPANIKATEFYYSLKAFNGSDYFNTDAPAQSQLMKQKKIAMCLLWSDYAYDLVMGSSRDDGLGFAPIPGGKSMIAGGSYYINRYTKHPAEAAHYVAYLMQKETQVKLMQRGLCSALRSAYDDPEVKKLPYVDALLESLWKPRGEEHNPAVAPRGVYMLEAGLDADTIQDAITTNIQRLWRGEAKSAEEALKDARRDIESKQQKIWAAQHDEKK